MLRVNRASAGVDDLHDRGPTKLVGVNQLPQLAPPRRAPKSSENFGDSNNAFARGDARFTLEQGSHLASSCSVGRLDVLAVLNVTGDIDTVLEGYAGQLGKPGHAIKVKRHRTRAGIVRYVESSPQGGGSGLVVSSTDRKWILIMTASD